MRLLVTRPQPDAERTAAVLRGMGHAVLVQPLLTVEFEAPPLEVPEPAAIVLTSQNALRALARWPQAVRWRDVPVFAAGPATARAASAAGFRDVRSGSGDAGSLADVVAKAIRPVVGPLLYPAARDRSGALDQRLTERGFDVTIVEAYRAEAAARLDDDVRDALADEALDGVLLYSRRTAEAFRDLALAAGLNERLARPTYYVISEQVAAALAGHGKAFRIAARPDEDSLLALIPPVG